jgi:hypothetical protein
MLMKQDLRGSHDLEEPGHVRDQNLRIVRNGDHIRLSILGMVCPRKGEFFVIETCHCDTDVFQVFLNEAAKASVPQKNGCLMA